MTETIDFDARYSVAGYEGVAFYLLGYVREHRWEDGERVIDWLGDLPDAWEVDETQVRAVMVGDDREHIVDVDDLTPLGDLDYCAICGQIGCGHDGRDRD